MTDKLINLLKTGKQRNAPVFTFFLTLFLGFLAFGLAGLLPNGTKGIFVCDMYGQYYSFYQALRHMVWSGADFSYSWYSGLGMGLSGWVAYYLMSPFNLIIILLPESLLQLGIVLMILLKLAVAGGVFAWFLKKLLNRDGFETVYFGICYAFCGYAVTYYFIPMWLDALILLPIVAHFARKLLLDNKTAGFTLSLAILFVDNYYMAYMAGIFIFAAFLISYFYYRKEKGIKGFVFVRFFVSVFLAAAMSAAIIGPTVLQMASRLGDDTEHWELLNFSVNPLNFYNNMFVDSYSTLSNGNPLIYCGLLAVIIVPLYFCSPRILKREKCYVAFGLLLLFSVMFFPLTNIIMHVGSTPTWFNYRYSYLFSLMLLIIACRQLPESIENTDRGKIKAVCLANIIFLAGGMAFVFILKTMGADKAGDVSGEHYIYDMNLWKLLLNVGIIGAVTLIICLAGKSENKSSNLAEAGRNASHIGKTENKFLNPADEGRNALHSEKNTEKKLFLCLLLVLEVCLNVFFTTDNIRREAGYVMPEDVEAYETTLEAQIEEAKRLDSAGGGDGFYRIMRNYRSTYNDGMQEGYRGIEFFNSVYSPKLTRFLSAVGMWANYWEYHDWGSTEFLKAVLNVKYTLHDKQEGFFVISSGNSEPFIEENPYYLPVGFMVSDDILNVEFTEGGENLDAMENQQRLLNAMLGTDSYEDMFKRIEPVSCEIINAEKTEGGGEITYKRTDMDKPASIRYKCSSGKGQSVYYYFTYKRTRWNNQMIGISTSDGENVFSSSIISMSAQVPYSVCMKQGLDSVAAKAGESSITIDFDEEEEYTVAKEYFYILDLNRWNPAYHILKKQPLTSISYKDKELSGTVTANEGQVLFTSIPYEDGWSVYVDGKREEVQPLADGAFLGVSLSEGEHEVRFVYNTPGRRAGIWISIAGILIFVISRVFAAVRLRVFKNE